MPRLVSVDDSFNLPAAVNVRNENLPDNLQPAALTATYAGLPDNGKRPVGKDELVFNIRDYYAGTTAADRGPAITAAFNAMKVGGKAQGTLIIPENVNVTTPVVLDGGYVDVKNDPNWTTGSKTRFRLKMDGSITYTGTAGQGLVVRGFYQPELELYFKDGGYRRSITATMAAGSNVVTYAGFTADYVGRTISVPNAAAYGELHATIVSVVPGVSAVLSATAANAVSAVTARVYQVAIHVENIIGASLWVDGNNFAGTLLHFDGSDLQASSSVVMTTVKKLRGLRCGQTLFQRHMHGGFGGYEDVWDSMAYNPSYIGHSDDTAILHSEHIVDRTAPHALRIEACNNLYVGYWDGGDTVTQSCVFVTGGQPSTEFSSVGVRFAHLRIGGTPLTAMGNGTEATLPVGLRVVDVASMQIDQLTTTRAVIGAQIEGSNVNIKRHHSITQDTTPLVIKGTPIYPGPRVDVKADYHFNYKGCAVIDSSVVDGIIKLSGHMDYSTNQSGQAVWAVDCASATAILDVSGLTQEYRSTFLGSINHPDMTKVRGLRSAFLGNPAATSGALDAIGPSVVAQTLATVSVANTAAETQLVAYTVPANAVRPGTTFRVTAYGSTDNIATSGTLAFRIRYGGLTGIGFGTVTYASNASAQSIKPFVVQADIVFRAAGASGVMAGGMFVDAQFGASQIGLAAQAGVTASTAVARDLVLTAQWATADAGNVLRCESATINLIKP